MISFSIPLRLVPQVNARDHWSKTHRRATIEKTTTWAIGLSALRRGPDMGPPYAVTITRVGPARMDSDNAIGAAKHVRDTIAKLLGVDDGDQDAITFGYAMKLGPFGVDVTIEGQL